MKRVAAIHTVASVYSYFPALIRESVGDVAVDNTFDDFLASDPAVKGEFTTNNLNRLHAILRCAEMTGADAIVVSCSTLTPPVEKLRPLIATPLVTIDGAMLKLAVRSGPAVTVMATARSAEAAVREGLAREAKEAGKELDAEYVVSDEAFAAIKRMDKETHDRLILEAARSIKGRDIIVLGQASMAHLEAEIAKITGIRTVSGPRLCMAELKEVLG